MPINWQVKIFDALPSTMDTARERAETGASEGTVIVARDQTQGMGRQGATWINMPGNLYLSLILRPIVLKDAGQYSFIAAVALAEVMLPRLKSGFAYKHKWPNDGLIKGLKFAGILPHTGKDPKSGEDFLNLGVGVNIASAPNEKIAVNEAFQQAVTAEDFMRLYLASLESQLDLYRTEGFAAIRRKWLENARGLGEAMKARLPDRVVTGVFDGLDETGALLLGLENGGREVIRSGEVFFGNEI